MFATSSFLVAVHIYVHVRYLKKLLPLDSIVLLDNEIIGRPVKTLLHHKVLNITLYR